MNDEKHDETAIGGLYNPEREEPPGAPPAPPVHEGDSNPEVAPVAGIDQLLDTLEALAAERKLNDRASALIERLAAEATDPADRHASKSWLVDYSAERAEG